MELELKEIVMRLVGPIAPVGDSNIDAERLKNLETLTRLIDQLVYDIDRLRPNAIRPEASMRKAGILARQFCEDLREAI